METFKWCVKPSFTVESEPKRQQIEFGDGYVQRKRSGIHNLLRKYALTVKVKKQQQMEVDNFLARHGGVEPFLFHDPYTRTLKKVVCGKWTPTVGRVFTEFALEFEETR